MKILVSILLVQCFQYCFPATAHCQNDTILAPANIIKYADQSSKLAGQLHSKIDKKTNRLLYRFSKQEDRMRRKLSKIDSSAAANLFAGHKERLQHLRTKLPGDGSYVPSIDTLLTSFKFLEGTATGVAADNVKVALQQATVLKSKLHQAESVQRYLKERKAILKEQLMKLGFAKELKKLNKEVYYYSQQLNEYKALLKDKRKASKKALELLSKTKLFKDFMRRNSMLASLFRLPGGNDDPSANASLAGLQTRVQVNSLIQQQVSAGGPGAQQQFRDNLSSAQSQLQNLKDKVLKAGGSSSNDELPDFKPNQQKTKKFLDRLEYGTNVQTQKANGIFPVTSDLALSVGYKLNDKSVIGVGSSYKIGWGSGWRNLSLTSQGVGLRSYVDYKIKGSFWLSGGYEMNYRSRINDIDQLRALSGWQQSGLIGISKVVSLKSKLFKKTKLQLLWDFLGSEQVPRTQPITFRMGYSLN